VAEGGIATRRRKEAGRDFDRIYRMDRMKPET
jgi:hypothetical protein